MSVEQDIYDALRLNSGVSTLAGNRIYPGEAPQNATYPRIIYGVLNLQPDLAHDGAHEGDRYVIEVVSMATDYESAKALRNAVTTALNTTNVNSGRGVVLLDDELDLAEFALSGGQTQVHRITQNYIVWAD